VLLTPNRLSTSSGGRSKNVIPTACRQRVHTTTSTCCPGTATPLRCPRRFRRILPQILNWRFESTQGGDLTSANSNKAFYDGLPKPVRDKVSASRNCGTAKESRAKAYEFSDAHDGRRLSSSTWTGDDSDSAAEPKKERRATTMDDLRRRVSEMTRMFTASVRTRRNGSPPRRPYRSPATPGG